MVIKLGVVEVGKICHAEELFRFGNAVVGKHNSLFLFLDCEIRTLAALSCKIVGGFIKLA